MATYMRDGTYQDHNKRVFAALDGIPFITREDFLLAMGAEPDLCDDDDLRQAEWDLRTAGYAKGYIALVSGGRAIFPRWVKTLRDLEWLDENVPNHDPRSARRKTSN